MNGVLQFTPSQRQSIEAAARTLSTIDALISPLPLVHDEIVCVRFEEDPCPVR
ncbi:MAG: hypothetical protein ACYCS4_07820 [Acidimicrobiales bacterium]